MMQLWGCLCAHLVGWASVEAAAPGSLDLCSWLLFPGGSLWLTHSLPVLHRVALKGGREPGQAATAAWALHGGCSGCLGTPKSLGLLATRLKIDWIFLPLSALISQDHFRPMSSGPYILLTQPALSGTLCVSSHTGAS